MVFHARKHELLPLEVVGCFVEDGKKILCGAVVGGLTEVYSLERINRVRRRFQLVLGSASDLTNSWNSSIASHRVNAMDHIREEKLMDLAGGPLCTMTSILQNAHAALHGSDPAWLEAGEKNAEGPRNMIGSVASAI